MAMRNTSDSAKLHNMDKIITEISFASVAGSAVPDFDNSANAPTPDFTTATKAISGGSTTPHPQINAAHPLRFIDFRIMSGLISVV